MGFGSKKIVSDEELDRGVDIDNTGDMEEVSESYQEASHHELLDALDNRNSSALDEADTPKLTEELEGDFAPKESALMQNEESLDVLGALNGKNLASNKMQEKEDGAQKGMTSDEMIKKYGAGVAVAATLITLPYMAAKSIFRKGVDANNALHAMPVKKIDNVLNQIAENKNLINDPRIISTLNKLNEEGYSDAEKTKATNALWTRLRNEDTLFELLGNKFDNGFSLNPKKLEKSLLNFVDKHKDSKEVLKILDKKLDNVISMIPEGFSPFKAVFEALKSVSMLVKNILKNKFGTEQNGSSKEVDATPIERVGLTSQRAAPDFNITR
jgi:hypothetical protein